MVEEEEKKLEIKNSELTTAQSNPEEEYKRMQKERLKLLLGVSNVDHYLKN